VPPPDDVVVAAAVTVPVPSLEPVGALLIVPAPPVLLETCCCVAAAVDASTVPVSLLPTVAVTCGTGGAAPAEVVSLGAGELVAAGALESLTENHPIPVSAPVVVVGVESAGAAAGSVGATDVSVGAGAGGVAGDGVAAAVVGNDTGVPTLSLTTAAFANGSSGAALLFAGGGACACTSDTTGMRCTILPT